MPAAERILRVLLRPELVQVARTFGVPRPLRASEVLIAELAKRPEVDPVELVTLLKGPALRRVAAVAGVRTSGTAEQVAKELARAFRFATFEEARARVQALGLISVREWRRWHKKTRPADLPTDPAQVYRHRGWAGYGDFLGTGRFGVRGRTFLPFEAARDFARSLALSDTAAWVAWYRGDRPDLPRRPQGVPTNPHLVYPSEFRGMGDWLGTGVLGKRNRSYRSLSKARALARQLGFRRQEDWNAWVRGARPDLPARPADVPFHPDRAYKAAWTSWGEFLGTGYVSVSRRTFLGFEEARALARSLGLRSETQWLAWCRGDLPGKPKRPQTIPTNPHRTYRGRGWRGMRDWLGTDR